MSQPSTLKVASSIMDKRLVTHAAEHAPKSSQGKRTQFVKPSIPMQREGSRLPSLAARLSLKV